MTVKFIFDNPLLKIWLLLHQTYNLVLKSEDVVFARLGLSTQQYAVLIAIKHFRGRVTPVDLANWLDRNPNGISMLLYRMEEHGLVERVRDLRDHRSLRVVMTDKGKKVLEQATIVSWQLVQEVLSRISEEELRMLIEMLEGVRKDVFEHLSPGKVMEEIKL